MNNKRGGLVRNIRAIFHVTNKLIESCTEHISLTRKISEHSIS